MKTAKQKRKDSQKSTEAKDAIDKIEKPDEGTPTAAARPKITLVRLRSWLTKKSASVP